MATGLNTESLGFPLVGVKDSLRTHLIGFLAIESIPIAAESLAIAAPIPGPLVASSKRDLISSPTLRLVWGEKH